jgi:hypothetical protein
MTNDALNETQLVATTNDLLVSAGYAEVAEDRIGPLRSSSSRLYEDEYSIVCVTVLPTWAELVRSWTDIQAALAELLSGYLKRTDAKSWDGYLVLITPSLAFEHWSEIEDIKTDTSRVRKLVGTGDDLKSYADVETLLSPLLPVYPSAATPQAVDRDPWSLVKRSLVSRGMELKVVNAVIRAYDQQRNLMEALRKTLNK